MLAWGGANTLAQALLQARATRTPQELDALVAKLRVYAISDQDDAGPWIRREFPALHYIAMPSTPDGEQYYLATWTGISGDRFYRNAPGADFTTFTDAWVNANIRSKGPLGKLYPMPCCIHEGDTPSFLGLINNGLASSMSPTYGGWGGRYVWRQFSARRAPSGRRAAIRIPAATTRATPWSASTASRTRPIRRRSGAGGPRSSTTSRRGWTGRSRTCARRTTIRGRRERAARARRRCMIDAVVGTPVTLDAAGTRDPDGNALTYTWFFYPEAGTGIPGQPGRRARLGRRSAAAAVRARAAFRPRRRAGRASRPHASMIENADEPRRRR